MQLLWCKNHEKIMHVVWFEWMFQLCWWCGHIDLIFTKWHTNIVTYNSGAVIFWIVYLILESNRMHLPDKLQHQTPTLSESRSKRKTCDWLYKSHSLWLSFLEHVNTSHLSEVPDLDSFTRMDNFITSAHIFLVVLFSRFMASHRKWLIPFD